MRLVRHVDGDSHGCGTGSLGRGSDKIGLLGALRDVEVDPELVTAVADNADLVAALVASSPSGRPE